MLRQRFPEGRATPHAYARAAPGDEQGRSQRAFAHEAPPGQRRERARIVGPGPGGEAQQAEMPIRPGDHRLKEGIVQRRIGREEEIDVRGVARGGVTARQHPRDGHDFTPAQQAQPQRRSPVQFRRERRVALVRQPGEERGGPVAARGERPHRPQIVRAEDTHRRVPRRGRHGSRGRAPCAPGGGGDRADRERRRHRAGGGMIPVAPGVPHTRDNGRVGGAGGRVDTESPRVEPWGAIRQQIARHDDRDTRGHRDEEEGGITEEADQRTPTCHDECPDGDQQHAEGTIARHPTA